MRLFRGNRLHKLVTQPDHVSADPRGQQKIDVEFRRIVQDINNDRVSVDHELAGDIEKASELHRSLGKLSLLDSYAIMDAAAITGDRLLGKAAIRTIHSRFPTSTDAYPVPINIIDDPSALAKFKDTRAAWLEANERTRKEWFKGMDIANESQGLVSFAQAILQAGSIIDREYEDKVYGTGFDNVINRSTDAKLLILGPSKHDVLGPQRLSGAKLRAKEYAARTAAKKRETDAHTTEEAEEAKTERYIPDFD